MARLEHSNITVQNPDQIAQLLTELFDWRIRWRGEAMNQGYTVHVGNQDGYLALYTNNKYDRTPKPLSPEKNKAVTNMLNHIGIEVSNLDLIEQRALKLGFKPYGHDDYEPGNRFYLDLPSNLEIEVVSYS